MKPWLNAVMISLVVGSLSMAQAGPKPSPSPAPPPPDPIKILSFTYQNSQLPNDQVNNLVQGHLIIKNTGKDPVTGVGLSVHIQDGNQVDLETKSQQVGTLKPDQTYTWDWSWRNYNSLFIDPLAEVIHIPTEKGADPKNLVGSTSRATSPAAGAPAEGGSVAEPTGASQSAPGMDASDTPTPPPPPGY